MKIAILTTAYPYYPGEQFIEEEIGYWANSSFTNIVLAPLTVSGKPRTIPEGINVDLCMSRSGNFECIYFMVLALFSNFFFKELVFLYRSRKIRVYTIALALVSVSRILQSVALLRILAKRNGGFDLVYCYWNNIQSYAATIVKKEGLFGKVITRVHRFDLYEERMRYDYMPLKRQFVEGFDAVFSLSKEGKNYFEKKYNALSESVKICPLGVSLPGAVSSPSPSGTLHLISISFCVPVKRIDKIIDSLALVADKIKYTSIKWTHIGDGPLLEKLRERAKEKLCNENVNYEFKGGLTNDEVKLFLLNGPVDFFINTSESEGIPVSIMEAMSYGIPAIAPNVGGVSHLISSQCGDLMSSNPTVEEIANKILKLSYLVKKPEIRVNAISKIENNFSASKNYTEFIQQLRNMLEVK